MSFLARLILRVIDPGDQTDESGHASSPQPEAQIDRTIINEFITLSSSTSGIDINERLRVFRQCNLTVSTLTAESSTRREVNNASVPLIYGRLGEMVTSELSSEPSSYVRMVKNPIEGPETSQIFKDLIQGTDTAAHPSGLSSLTFAFANIIWLCISYPDRSDVKNNKASGLLDLFPLYGLTDEDSQTIRVLDGSDKGYGLLLPDTFFEDGERLEFLPPSTSVLLILFNRNHNYIARRLLQENEKGKWVDPSTLEDGPEKDKQDDEIFQLAHRINCGMLRNIVVNDFLKGLLGFGSNENGLSIDLFSDVKPEEIGSHRTSVEFSLLFGWLTASSDADTTYIKDKVVSEIGDISELDVSGLEEYFNEYTSIANMVKDQRPCVGLERDDSGRFNDSELANVLQGATEETAKAFKARAISPDLKVFELAAMDQARQWEVCSLNEFRKALGLPPYTSFMEWCSDPDVASAAQTLYNDIDHLELYVGLRGERTMNGPGFQLGQTMTYGLVAEIVRVVRSDPNFSRDFTRETLTNWGFDELRPNPNNGAFGAELPKLLLRHLPNDYTYNNVYGLFPFLTPGKAIELLQNSGSSDTQYDFGRPTLRPVYTLGDMDKIQTVLNDNEKFSTPYGEDLKRLTGGYGYMLGFDDKKAHDEDEWMTLKALIPDKGALGRYADYYRETTERLIKEKSTQVGGKYHIDIIQDVINAAAASWAAEQLCGISLNSAKGFTERELFQMLKDLNDCIFGNVEPQDTLTLRSKAIKAAKAITIRIQKSLRIAVAVPDEESTSSRTASLLKELFLDEPPEHNDSHAFLAKLAASGRDVRELSANTLGLAILSSVAFAQTLSVAVRFYLEDAQSVQRDDLIGLSKRGPDVNGRVMGYIRESQRLNPQIPVLHRDVAVDQVLTFADGTELTLKKGDRIRADFRKAFPDDPTIDPERETPSIQGAGFHKCVGIPFVEKTMPEAFKAIFRLEDLQRERGSGGIQSLNISYKKPKDVSQGGEGSISKGKGKKPIRQTPFIQRACDGVLVILVIVIFYWIILAIGGVFSRFNTLTCANPTHLRPWEVYTMFPGPDNRTAPFIATLEHSRKRRLTFIDIDKRDMRFKVSVDGRGKRVSTNFVANDDIDCGQDVDKCIALGFSRASIIVPSGKHTIKVEWIGKDFLPGTNSIDWGSECSRRFMWKQETC